MAFDFDPGALLGRSYPLEGGLRVCLRLTRPSDVAAIARLLEGAEESPAGSRDLAIRRLVSFDPRRRCVLCATALIGSGERMMGVGSIELGTQPASEPELLVVDPQAGDELRRLLAGALVGRAAVLARSRAA